jgi:hypothetical protein
LASRDVSGLGRAAALLGLCLTASACLSQQELAAQLGRSLAQPNVPNVVACWEAEFESAGFRGQYRAEVDFTVAADGSVGDVEVRKVEAAGPTDGKDAPPDGSASLGACLKGALDATNIAAAGWVPSAPVRVNGFVLAFTDGSAEVRAAAKAAGTPVVIGPRSDRCAGLYAYHPPREPALLDAEMAEARGQAERAAELDRDGYARALQRIYDLALELRRRLELDAGNSELGEESRARTLQRRDEAAKLARDTGERIGCEPPMEF